MRKKILLFLVLVCSLCLITGCQKQAIELKKKEVTLEYGESFNISLNKLVKGDTEGIKVRKINFKYENFEKKKILKPGIYYLELTRGEIHKKVKIKVVDHHKPIIKVAKNIKIQDEMELSKYIDAYDLVGKEKVRLIPEIIQKNGRDDKGLTTYNIQVVDRYGNQTNKQIKVSKLQSFKKLTFNFYDDKGIVQKLLLEYDTKGHLAKILSEIDINSNSSIYKYLQKSKSNEDEVIVKFNKQLTKLYDGKIDLVDITKNNSQLVLLYEIKDSKLLAPYYNLTADELYELLSPFGECNIE